MVLLKLLLHDKDRASCGSPSCRFLLKLKLDRSQESTPLAPTWWKFVILMLESELSLAQDMVLLGLLLHGKIRASCESPSCRFLLKSKLNLDESQESDIANQWKVVTGFFACTHHLDRQQAIPSLSFSFFIYFHWIYLFILAKMGLIMSFMGKGQSSSLSFKT